MKKIIIAIVLVAATGITSCKKDEATVPVPSNRKSMGDIKEHTGWERDNPGIDGDGSTDASLLRTSSPAIASPATDSSVTKKPKIKTK